VTAAREPIEVALLAAAAEANERIARCHEVVACPRCHAPIGKRCAALSGPGGGGYAELTVKAGRGAPCTSYVRMGRELKRPHRERWTLVQLAR
jgi:hypothetical protein